ncbi:MAG TPA: ABC transporter permease [Spirochaetales bacterium]|nr:ABC transporter permease [Spirochaetales bacterium]HRY55889.1 ABC transporter permease [Spirochaetia bacterium]HRZ63483.1 ABC transporter permease [Spirochaetia bacterium]
MERIREFVSDFGLPRIIIALFLVLLFVAAPFVGVSVASSLSNTIARFGMNGIMVLAMVPMIHSGCGLNFGLPLGVIAGLLGATISIEMGLVGAAGFAAAAALALAFAALLGYGYGKLLNRVKGDEMMIATYVGFSSITLMSIGWIVLPYQSPTMVWGFEGEGLRTTISVEAFWDKILNDFLAVRIGERFVFPTGMILAFCGAALAVWFFLHLKSGSAMTAAGSNPAYARASGIDVDRMRTGSVVFSTMLGALGIVVYQQSFGFIQLYEGPFSMTFPSVAAILIGGASVTKASIANVFLGTFLFQGILTMTPSVINSVLKTDLSEVIRIIVSNGMILYALTRKTKVAK